MTDETPLCKIEYEFRDQSLFITLDYEMCVTPEQEQMTRDYFQHRFSQQSEIDVPPEEIVVGHKAGMINKVRTTLSKSCQRTT